jgi:hypothetical protein
VDLRRGVPTSLNITKGDIPRSKTSSNEMAMPGRYGIKCPALLVLLAVPAAWFHHHNNVTLPHVKVATTIHLTP